ncbi:MAG: hypothetical protein V1897_02915 [Pseudomonadota bacterium]
MGFINWLSNHLFSLIQVIGIIGGLTFTAVSFRMEARTRKVSNFIAITKNHREIWSELYTHPELARVLSAKVDLERDPIKPEEEIFVKLLILHLNSAFYAWRYGEFLPPDELSKDIREFFSLPLPRLVWDRLRLLQDKEFVRFVENICRAE